MSTERDPREAHGADAGDLGRRVRARRLELGLSVSEAARRAGMHPGYLGYLEEHVAQLPGGALLRLAAALETTADALSGGGIDRPPGGGPAGVSPELAELGVAECRRLLARGGVGRVVFATEEGPTAMPVNFGLLGGDVVFRTANDGILARALGQRGTEIGFEVDHVDDALAQGWSVLVHGRAHPVSDAHELAGLEGSEPEPWAGGQRSLYVRVVASELTGRRIRVGS